MTGPMAAFGSILSERKLARFGRTNAAVTRRKSGSIFQRPVSMDPDFRRGDTGAARGSKGPFHALAGRCSRRKLRDPSSAKSNPLSRYQTPATTAPAQISRQAVNSRTKQGITLARIVSLLGVR